MAESNDYSIAAAKIKRIIIYQRRLSDQSIAAAKNETNHNLSSYFYVAAGSLLVSGVVLETEIFADEWEGSFTNAVHQARISR